MEASEPRTWNFNGGRLCLHTVERRIRGHALLGGEVHMTGSGMSQQFLGVAPKDFLAYLWLEIVERVEVFHPALGHDERIIRAKQEAIW